jgi:hypothetical protein
VCVCVCVCVCVKRSKAGETLVHTPNQISYNKLHTIHSLTHSLTFTLAHSRSLPHSIIHVLPLLTCPLFAVFQVGGQSVPAGSWCSS